ncbi:hypothetical protein [Niabella beijingensis]|uniref:hypothetical protein n=1 Tax=Niabella beijingensis TaxID=2872700 RepID=UPI001CBB5866|nr:hypothetical protein [Niabella beijingensis]MBZ4191564.1 hypothetical protein [Niabella beijingensis]
MKNEENDFACFFNELINSAYNDYNSITFSSSEIKALIFGNSINLHRISDARKCSVKYCRKKAVMSHLFQESILRKIASAGHLIAPNVDFKKIKVELMEVGINRAFTFPGFCKEHENLFEYERKESIEFEQELRLLIYKNVCYHQVFWDVAVKKTVTAMNRAVEKKHSKFENIFGNKYSEGFADLGIDLEKMRFPDLIQEHYQKDLKDRKKEISRISKFKNQIWEDIKHNKDKNIRSYVVELSSSVPIFLSYNGELTIKYKRKYFNHPVNYIVHPFKNSTIVVFSVVSSHFKSLKEILSCFSAIEIVQFICYSMVYVSDNWLVNPDFYKRVYPPALREIIESAHTLPIPRSE